jgi:AAA domain-containing protein
MAGLTLELLEKEFAQEEAKDSESKRPPLTIRTIDEILAMEFDPADLILPNGYLTAGDLTSICGIGGIGKSRLTMQFAMCCRAGRDFLRWPTNGRDLRFLFLQTENSCRRLHSDLQRMLGAFKPDEQSHIKEGIFFHTLENDDDGFLALDSENQARVGKAILETVANVIVCDPLRDFSLDDLNSDKVMGDTLRDILRVTKRGNPKRVPLTVHHAVTGKGGVQKVTGWERASFGRNSKVLLMMARAVINIGQARPDDNTVIIIASGKCNNAPEFKPFAAEIDFDTLLYYRDDDFDMQNWQNEITRKGTGTGRTTPCKGTIEDMFNLIPPIGSISQNLLLKTATDESMGTKRLAEKKARQFLAILIENGRAFPWYISRPRVRPSIRISRQPQPEEKAVQQDLPA